MSKTVAFPSARQPSADDWVGGTSTETQKSAKTERQKAVSTETRKSVDKLARLTIDLPEELHARFKAACAQRRTKMKDEVLHFIEQWTQKHGNL
jgi:ParG